MLFPVDFENRMKEYLGEEFSEFLASYSKEEVKALRVNKLKSVELQQGLYSSALVPSEDKSLDLNCITPAANEQIQGLYSSVFVPSEDKSLRPNHITPSPGTKQASIKDSALVPSGERVPWESLGWYYEADKMSPGKSPLHEAGAYYIQEASAMAPVRALSVNPGERVLDLCASPGGKSTQIASYLNGEGILISNEIVPQRAKILSENIERMGIRNALVISEDPRNISDKFAGFFDKILVDAPCSGEGMFRRSDIAVEEWSLENVRLCAERQSWILDEAYKMLSPGGRLVYSTCTFSKDENEENALGFVSRHSDMSIVSLPEDFFVDADSCTGDDISENTVIEKPEDSFNSDEIKSADSGDLHGIEKGYDGIGYRLWPHKINGEGHFFCIFEKKSEGNDTKAYPVYGYEKGISKKERSDLKEMDAFLKENMTEPAGFTDGIFTKFGDYIYLLPDECPNLKGIKVLRPGLQIGSILKGRFEPSHSLAMSLRPYEYKNVVDLSLNNDVIYKYLRGETFNTDFSGKGWYLITVEGVSTGFGKLTGSIMKNHYPKGLRKQL